MPAMPYMRTDAGSKETEVHCFDVSGPNESRGFAHNYDTGGMRRIHLRGHENIFKRLVTHVAGHNLGLLMRQICGAGTPRGLQDLNVLFESMTQRIQHSRIASFLCKTRLSLVA